MPSVIQNHPLRLAERFLERLYFGVQRISFVVATVEHEPGRANVRSEINRAGLGNPSPAVDGDASGHQYDRAVRRLDRSGECGIAGRSSATAR